jgi:hypothetical protein
MVINHQIWEWYPIFRQTHVSSKMQSQHSSRSTRPTAMGHPSIIYPMHPCGATKPAPHPDWHDDQRLASRASK